MPPAEKPGAAFYSRADEHIQLANKHGDDVGFGKSSASFLFAASRYNAFVIAANAESADVMRAERDAAVEYFVDQFRRMLEDNVDEFINNFDRNLRGGEA